MITGGSRGGQGGLSFYVRAKGQRQVLGPDKQQKVEMYIMNGMNQIWYECIEITVRRYTANVYRQMTDELMFKSVISTQ